MNVSLYLVMLTEIGFESTLGSTLIIDIREKEGKSQYAGKPLFASNNPACGPSRNKLFNIASLSDRQVLPRDRTITEVAVRHEIVGRDSTFVIPLAHGDVIMPQGLELR